MYGLPQLILLHFTTSVRANSEPLTPWLYTFQTKYMSTQRSSRVMQYFPTDPTLEVVVNGFYKPLQRIAAIHAAQRLQGKLNSLHVDTKCLKLCLALTCTA